MIAYNCKYTPIELLKQFDDCMLINSSAENFDYADTRIHPNMCSHVKAMLEEIHAAKYDRLFLMNCCTSTVRMKDVLEEETPVRMMDLPAEANGCSVEKLKEDLLGLIPELEQIYGKPFSKEQFAASFHYEPQVFPETPFLLLLGARSTPPLLEAVHSCFQHPVIDMTCANNGRVLLSDIHPSDDTETMMRKYARALLSQIPCMRMSDVQARRQLLEQEHCIGIIYHTVKFCDYYHFEYSDLLKENIPMVKIETDYTRGSAGQILTRLEGFAESLQAKYKRPESLKINKEKNGTDMKNYYAGIDSGSTSTELVILDEQKNIVKTVMLRTGANAANSARKALESAGIPPEEIAKTVATGYGRKNIPFADASVTEITCHAKGAVHLCPQARMIVDIGGQDSKVINLDENGTVTHFVMNDKCAAGTGRFLENMSKVLEMDLPQMAARGLNYKEDLTISSMCTVFAESEVVSLIAENHSAEDIIHGLNKSVAVKTKALVRNIPERGKVMMTGGVARNAGVAGELSKQLGTDLFVPEIPEYCGALGAALLAWESGSSPECGA